MNNDYYMKDESSGESKPEGESSRDAENKIPWYQNIRGRIKPIFTNPMFTTFINVSIFIAFMIYWYYEIEASENQQLAPPIGNTNSHILIIGSSGWGKTSFLAHSLTQIIRKSNYLVFGRNQSEFHEQNFVPLLQLEKIVIESLANKPVLLDDAGAYKSLKTNVEDLFWFCEHHNIQVICLAHYAKDVLPKVRENCLKLYLTTINPDNCFESIIQTYSIKDANNSLHKKNNTVIS